MTLTTSRLLGWSIGDFPHHTVGRNGLPGWNTVKRSELAALVHACALIGA